MASKSNIQNASHPNSFTGAQEKTIEKPNVSKDKSMNSTLSNTPLKEEIKGSEEIESKDDRSWPSENDSVDDEEGKLNPDYQSSHGL